MVYYGIGVVTMAKPWFLLKAEQSIAADLSADRTVSRDAASPRRRDLVFIVNPKGANGRTGKDWKTLLPYIRSRLGTNANICESLTSGPSHAIDITREAIQEGAHAVIAVGGDGTLHEVINGFFWGGKPVYSHDTQASHTTALGLIPLGTGSDFARTFNWENNPQDAIECIAKGRRSRIDVGVINGEGDESHYFSNVADIHLSAKAGYYASRYKRFGNLCYVIGALQSFFGHHNRDLKIKVNEGEWEVYPQVTAFCIGNAKFFGGGMKITPNADPSSGKFEVVALQNFKWYDFIFKMHRLYAGTHLTTRNVSSISNFHFVHEFVTIVMESAILFYGVLPWFWKKSGEFLVHYGFDAENEILVTLSFLAGVMFWSQITDLPFSLYSTFVIEARHGFNKQTIWLFFRDRIKGIVLSVIIGPPIVAAMIVIVQKGGPYLAIYLWGFMFVLSLVMMTIYPILIAPLFNKFTPFPDGELRSQIEKLVASLKFPLKKLFVVDGSTRSSHSNCKNEEEIVAVIAHELGHWQLNHTMYTFIFVQHTVMPLHRIVSFALNLVSRAFEFQADGFAKKLGYTKPLRAALVKLQEENLSSMNTDPWYSA